MSTVRVAVATLLGWLLAGPAWGAGVEVGQKAPVLEAESTHGPIRLSSYQGAKNVILAFYFRDFTSG